MNKFTKGKVDAIGFYDCYDGVVVGVQIGDDLQNVATFHDVSGEDEGLEMSANTDLFVSAHTTATKLAEKGYDAVKVLEALPELVAHAEVGSVAHVYQLLEQCRGE